MGEAAQAPRFWILPRIRVNYSRQGRKGRKAPTPVGAQTRDAKGG